MGEPLPPPQGQTINGQSNFAGHLLSRYHEFVLTLNLMLEDYPKGGRRPDIKYLSGINHIAKKYKDIFSKTSDNPGLKVSAAETSYFVKIIDIYLHQILEIPDTDMNAAKEVARLLKMSAKIDTDHPL
jgi:hypothetical protein